MLVYFSVVLKNYYIAIILRLVNETKSNVLLYFYFIKRQKELLVVLKKGITRV